MNAVSSSNQYTGLSSAQSVFNRSFVTADILTHSGKDTFVLNNINNDCSPFMCACFWAQMLSHMLVHCYGWVETERESWLKLLPYYTCVIPENTQYTLKTYLSDRKSQFFIWFSLRDPYSGRNDCDSSHFAEDRRLLKKVFSILSFQAFAKQEMKSPWLSLLNTANM